MKHSPPRLYELDAAKFIAMLFMMAGHVLFALVSPQQLDTSQPPWSLWNWWRGITAPVFLTISGILFSLTLRRTDAGTVERAILARRTVRALQLLAIGYLLVFPARRIYELPFVDDTTWHAFVQVNILQLIAVTLFALVICARLSQTPRAFTWCTGVVALGVALVTPFVHQVKWYEHLPSILAAYLSYEGGSIFPVFPFSAYMFAGAWMGSMLRDRGTEHLHQLRWQALVFGGVLIAVGVLGAMISPAADIYRTTPFGVAIRQGVALLVIVVVSVALPLFRPIQSLLVLFGKQALAIYVIHLVLLYGTPWFDSIARYYPNALSIGEGLLAAGAIITLTLGSVVVFHRIRAYLVHPTVLRLLRVGVGVILGLLLLA
jgi:uncharacterized membrane protein